jgi:lipoyl(octanoyl) transferase
MEEALIRLCCDYGVPAGRLPGLTGVWCGLSEPQSSSKALPCAAPVPERKICAIGIHVSRGITSHGFAFNVTTNLRNFELIIPCGIPDHPVTSLQQEPHSLPELPTLETIAHQAAQHFAQVFGQQLQPVETLAALRAQAAAAPPQFPAEDTPLHTPPEVERLRGSADPPLRA